MSKKSTGQAESMGQAGCAEEAGSAEKAGSVGEYIAALLASRFKTQVTHHRLLPGSEAAYAASRRPWPAAVQGVLDQQGIALFTHQALATDHLRAGRSVVVATPTASGKSLIYNLPVLEGVLRDPDARALYLFPLKALAQDQKNALEALTAHWPAEARPSVGIYDGDTSDHFRRKMRRDPPSVLITNPEMLHLAILPFHEQWTAFLAGLTHVVVDEAHTYRGVLGAHMAQLFRRLGRIAGRYGAKPTYALCTATVGNPGELAAQLLGAEEGEARVITESGAPQGPRHFVFVNPDDSPSTTAIALLKAALARNLRTIVYCRSRRMTELISLWATGGAGDGGEKSGQTGQTGQPQKSPTRAWSKRISAYRAGFLPEERRQIEARMHSGELLAIITTSALELGIDIGSLDVCILVGYPGTVMSTLQRGGRVGRAQQESAVILVAGEDALDQYIVRHAADFFSRPAEKAVLNPDNEVILRRHLECAAAEMPLRPATSGSIDTVDARWLSSDTAKLCIHELERQGLLLRSADGTEWLAARKRPQRHVDLRGCGASFTIEDQEGTVIGSVDGLRAFRETHPGAVYLHRGVTYEVTNLDMGTHTVKARPTRVSWFTRVRSSKATDILEIQDSQPVGCTTMWRGRLRITETITGYEKRSVSGNRLLTIVPLDFPPHVFETEGLWIAVPDAVRLGLEEDMLHFMGAIHALEHAAIGMLPLLVMADRNDFGGISTPMHLQVGLPAVFIYDGLPGGAGLTRMAFGDAEGLLRVTRQAITDCECEDGCPSCVHSPKCGSGNRPISKAGAAALLDALLRPLGQGQQAPAMPAPLVMPALPALIVSSEDFSPSLEAHNSTMLPTTAQTPPARYMVLDVETRRSAAEVGGWHKAACMGVSVAVLYDAGDDSFTKYTQDELENLFARLREADVVVGFNIARFDYAVLQPFATYPLAELPTLDLLARIKERLSYRVSLDNVAQATLNEAKSADGLQALRWWQEGKVEEIAVYCRKDVDITRRVYLHGLDHGHVLFTNKANQKVRATVDFVPHSEG